MVSPLFFNTFLELPFQPYVGVRKTDHKGLLDAFGKTHLLFTSFGMILLVQTDSLYPSRMIPQSGYSWIKFQIWPGRYRALSWRMHGRRQGALALQAGSNAQPGLF